MFGTRMILLNFLVDSGLERIPKLELVPGEMLRKVCRRANSVYNGNGKYRERSTKSYYDNERSNVVNHYSNESNQNFVRLSPDHHRHPQVPLARHLPSQEIHTCPSPFRLS